MLRTYTTFPASFPSRFLLLLSPSPLSFAQRRAPVHLMAVPYGDLRAYAERPVGMFVAKKGAR